MTELKEFVTLVKKVLPSKEDKLTTLELLLVDTSDSSVDVYIHEILINEKRAVKLWAY